VEEAAAAGRRTFAGQFTGRRVRVLVERTARGLAAGWSGEYLETLLPAAGLKRGDIVEVAVASAAGDVLHGEAVA
jgi:tRNA A37 methylthiotransferase MiaB